MPIARRRLRPLKWLLAASSVLLVGALALTLSLRADGSSGVLNVGLGGHATISAAVNAASSGDTILVAPGVYQEMVTVDTPVSIQAIAGGVWIDGGCNRENGLLVHANNVTIRGLGVRKTDESGIRIDGANDVTVDDVTVQDYNCDDSDDQFEAGIAVWEGARLTVTDSTITRRSALNGGPKGFGNGIWIKNTSQNGGGGHYIADNIITGGFDGIGGEPEDSVSGGFYRDSVIERNQISDCWDDGIQVEGGNINVAVRDNTIYRCSVGVAMAPTLTGPLYVERNQIRDLQIGYYDAQFAFKLGDGSKGTIFITENVVVSDGDGFKETNGGGVGKITSRRNIILVDRKVIEIGSISNTASSFDQDCLWTTDPNRFISWRQTEYPDLATFQNSTGQESNGIEGPDCDLPPPGPTTTPVVTTTQPPVPPTPTASTLTAAPTPFVTPIPTLAPTPSPTFRTEDVNGDGAVDALDALGLLKFAAGLAGGVPGDLNCDNQATPADALIVMSVVAGTTSPLIEGC